MFERFTQRARVLMAQANEAAMMLRHDHIGLEHILIALLGDRESAAAMILEAQGVDLDRVSSELADRASAEPPSVTQPRGAKIAIEFAIEEARTFRHQFLGSEHLLLGVARAGQGVSGEVLAQFGVEDDVIRAAVFSLPEAGTGEPG